MFKSKINLKTQNIRRVLIIRLSALGDIALNLPLLAALKAKGYYVGWVTQEDYAAILQDHPQLDQLYLIPWRKWQSPKVSLWQAVKAYFKIVKRLREDRYDLVIDAQGLFKSWIFTINANIPWHITTNDAREGATWLATHLVDLARDHHAKAVSLPKKFLSLLEPLGIFLGNNLNASECYPQLPTVNISTAFNDLHKPLVVIAPCTTRANKFWAQQNWLALIKKLPETWQLVFTGQSKDLEYLQKLARPQDMVLAGQTTLQELMGLMKLSQLVITVDSGSAHLAWALQKPKVIVIYTSTSCRTYDLDVAPIMQQHTDTLASWHQDNYWTFLDSHLPCQPCEKKRCPLAVDPPCCAYPREAEIIASVALQLVHLANP